MKQLRIIANEYAPRRSLTRHSKIEGRLQYFFVILRPFISVPFLSLNTFQTMAIEAHGYFVLRVGPPYRGLQLVYMQYGRVPSANVIRFGEGENPTHPLTWRLGEIHLANEEKQAIRHLNDYKSGIGLDWRVRISKYYLYCVEVPHLRFRIMSRNCVKDCAYDLPLRKDSIVIPLKEMTHQHTIPAAEDRKRILEILRIPGATEWFQESILTMPRTVGVPVRLAAPSTALSSYIANTLVQHARSQPDAHCPITYDPLTECTKFCVGNCGHVYSDAVAAMQSCPLCNKAVTWTAVEIPA